MPGGFDARPELGASRPARPSRRRGSRRVGAPGPGRRPAGLRRPRREARAHGPAHRAAPARPHRPGPGRRPGRLPPPPSPHRAVRRVARARALALPRRGQRLPRRRASRARRAAGRARGCGRPAPHLREGATCPPFRAELRASQAWVKDLAAEELDSEALAAMRVRTIVAAARARRSRRPRWVPAWVAAAAVILALGTLVWVALVSRTRPPGAVAVSSPPRIAKPAIPIAPLVIASGSARSTLPGPPAVSPHMEQAQVRRGRGA